MNQNFTRRKAMKAMAAIGGLLAVPGVSFAQNNDGNFQESGWVYQGLPCAIYQQGSMLLLINEVGSVGSAVWTGANTFVVLGGSGWDAGLVAQISKQGRVITWSNATVWTKDKAPRRAPNLNGGWLFQGQPCAIFQQTNQFVLVNEVGSIGTGIWTANNSLTIIGGNGWDLALTAQVADHSNTLNWSNNTVWIRA